MSAGLRAILQKGERMTTLEKIRAEIEKIKNIDDNIKSEYAKLESRSMAIVLEIIDKCAEQEPYTDSVSRQAVLEMAYDMSEIDGEHFNKPCMVVNVEDIRKLPSVRPQDPQERGDKK